MSNHRPRVLIVDDDPAGGEALAEGLARLDAETEVVRDGAAALARLDRGEYALVVTDLVIPDHDGMEVMRRARERWPDTVVIVVTGYATVERAVSAMTDGAFTFLTKPVNLAQFREVAKRALEQRGLRQDNRRLRSELTLREGLPNLVGQSAAIEAVRRVVRQLAPTETTVLLTGESGTGKEVVARAIHATSKRQGGIFLPVNCGAIAPTLLESELFGHEQGAFTGAVRARQGFFELARGGTLFLDEIADLPLDLQSKLLRVLEDGTFYRVGSSAPLTAEIRLIAATNRDLERAVREKTFREDLFYRLNVVALELPPLRDRPEDIPLLAETFLRQDAERHQRDGLRFAPEVLAAFQAYRWPGNVRELKNAIESMVVLARGTELTAADLPAKLRGAAPAEPPCRDGIAGLTLAALEKMAIAAALREHQGKRRAAARALGVPERTFYRKLKEYGLS